MILKAYFKARKRPVVMNENLKVQQSLYDSGVPRGGGWGFKHPPPEIPKALQNRANLNPIVKTVKNC